MGAKSSTYSILPPMECIGCILLIIIGWSSGLCSVGFSWLACSQLLLPLPSHQLSTYPNPIWMQFWTLWVVLGLQRLIEWVVEVNMKTMVTSSHGTYSSPFTLDLSTIYNYWEQINSNQTHYSPYHIQSFPEPILTTYSTMQRWWAEEYWRRWRGYLGNWIWCECCQ